MNQLFFLLMIGFGLLSCDKNKQTTKKIDGKWELISYKLTNYEGLIEYGSGDGTWSFESKAPYNEAYPYTCDYSFEFPSGLKSVALRGTFKVVSKGQYIDFTLEDSTGAVMKTCNYRILTHTKDDLEIEYLDEQTIRHNYLLKKIIE